MSEPININFGLEIAGRLESGRPGVDVTLVASAAIDLSALKLRLETMRLPMSLTLKLPDRAEDPLSLEFAPPFLQGPAGGSAELALPGFTGGGYLKHVGEEWSGALEVNLGFVDVAGFGVITTREFSMLVVLAAEFDVPIQLSFGFTLEGVGGMIGINRRPNTEALVKATSNGDLARLFFPRNAVADAPRILPTLSACFPRSDGDVIVGPMLKLGWGTPTLASATIGVLVGTQGVLVVGRLAVILPTEELDLIHLEAVVFGNVDAEGLYLAASVVNSHIVGISIYGDIRLRIRVGEHAFFAFSAGGFHPAFRAPEGMGEMRRIGAEFSPGGFLRIRLESYFAVTSNSVQFGAGVELYASFGFVISGRAQFDALIVLDPFGFLVDFEAHVSAKVAGISVASLRFSGHLSGPSPWCIRGSASISLPIIPDIDIDLPEISWGSPAAEPLGPARDPKNTFLKQLTVTRNWSAGAAAIPSVARLRPGVQAGVAAVHPLGNLRFQQAEVPLNHRIQRIDGRPLPAATTLSVATGTAVTSQFAPSQYFDMDDKAKLSSSDYVTLDGGFDVHPTTVVHGPGVQIRDGRNQEITVLGDSLRVRRFRGLIDLAFGAYARPDIGEEVTSLMVKPRDPAEVRVTSRLDPQVSAAVVVPEGVDLTVHAGVAEHALASLVSSGGASVDAVVSRQWEASLQ